MLLAVAFVKNPYWCYWCVIYLAVALILWKILIDAVVVGKIWGIKAECLTVWSTNRRWCLISWSWWGVNKKGTVYGLDSESKAYYKRPTSARHPARATYTPSVLSQMEAHLKKSENELHIAMASLKKSEEEVHATREELKATKEELSTRIASLEALINTSSSSRTPSPCT